MSDIIQVTIRQGSTIDVALQPAEVISAEVSGVAGPPGPTGPTLIYVGETPPDPNEYPLWLLASG